MTGFQADEASPGEMLHRVRAMDWSRTPLGPQAHWSECLRVVTDLVLASGFPMSVRWGPQLTFIYNDAYRPILADRHPQALGRPLREVWSEIHDTLGPLSEAILRGERPAYFETDQPWRIRRNGIDQEARFTICYSPIPDRSAPHGIGGIMTTCVETTERYNTEQALRLLNETLEAQVAQRTLERDRIWQVSEDLLGVSNFEGHFLSVNPAWTTLLGWSEAEIKRIHVDELRHPADTPHSRAGRARLAAGVATVRIENRFRHKDGTWRWVSWTMTAEGSLIYLVGRDITAEKEAAIALQRAQQQLAQSQKMEALGQLTGGIAHDFNNMLMVVSGNAQQLKSRIDNPWLQRSIEAIELAAARGETLTRQLLSFSRRQAVNPLVIDLGQRVGAFRDVLRSSARGNIGLVIDIPRDVWPVSIDVPALELALVNLVVNARDAMPEGGTITIAAANLQLGPGDTPDGVAGEFVGLSVSDSGWGIPPDILPKVFEPFFTTKAPEEGTGLGLSQVYGFSRQSGGTVVVSSRPERGTVVTLYLPRSTAALAPDPEAEGPEEAAQEGEKILLVEDNPEVREIAVSLLDQLGYRVWAAAEASAALELLGGGERFDLMFSDIVMPGELDGISLARRVHDQFPEIKILLTTGYAQAASAAASGFPILRKPYRLAVLAHAIRDALDGERAGEESLAT